MSKCTHGHEEEVAGTLFISFVNLTGICYVWRSNLGILNRILNKLNIVEKAIHEKVTKK